MVVPPWKFFVSILPKNEDVKREQLNFRGKLDKLMVSRMLGCRFMPNVDCILMKKYADAAITVVKREEKNRNLTERV